MTRLTPAHRQLIRVLAEAAVEEFLEQQTGRIGLMTPDAARERNNANDKSKPILPE